MVTLSTNNATTRNDESDSDLSDAASIHDEEMEAKIVADVKKSHGLHRFFKKAPKEQQSVKVEPEPPKRAPSPPHEYVLADNEAIAFLVMFRSRFSECFAQRLPHFGPQDIEAGIKDAGYVSEDMERFLCGLLDLVANRKKPVERGHYMRALEDALSDNKNNWPRSWNKINPLSGNKTFITLEPEARLDVLRTLALWALSVSEQVSATIKAAYKQNRREDDRNQPKAVQPWFTDSWRRKYYLIEGQEDTFFRIYRENDGRLRKTNQWFSVAGTIDEAKDLAEKLEMEMPGNNGLLLANKIRGAVPRWEGGDEKRRRKAYRQEVKARFQRPEPGFGFYEGRTRGKRARYTFEDDDEEAQYSESGRSIRDGLRSDRSTPADDRPIITASGRQVKSRLAGIYGEGLSSDQQRETRGRGRARDSEEAGDNTARANGRPARKAQPTQRARNGYVYLSDDDESDIEEAHEEAEEAWTGDGNETSDEDQDQPDIESENESSDELMDDLHDEEPSSLVVRLNYNKQQNPLLNGHPAHTNSNGRAGTPLVEVSNVSDLPDVKSTILSSSVNGTMPKVENLKIERGRDQDAAKVENLPLTPALTPVQPMNAS